MSIQKIFFATAFVALVGWIAVIGKAVILPLVIAVMLTYVLVGAAFALRRLHILGGVVPFWLAYALVVVLFALSLGGIALVALENLRNIARTIPELESTVLDVIARISSGLGMTDRPTWDTLRTLTLDRVDLADLSLNLASAVAGVGGYTVLIVTYVVFMVAERTPLSAKVDLVLSDDTERGAARELFNRINDQIVTYLSTKTLINVILGVISYLLMLVLGIENAVFWAFMIALFNYIPYVGSLIGVGIVSLYAAILFVDLGRTLLTLILLAAAQVYVGNWLEPRVMSRSLNLSPLVVLVALVLWSSLWGLTGAIIAVPMTSIIMIALSAFDATRFIPILLSRDGEVLRPTRPVGTRGAPE